MSALANVPGLAGYLEAKQQNDASTTGNLQKAAMIQGLLAHMQQQQQADQLRTAMSQSGGDVEKALQAALQSGNVAAAHQLAPLVKIAQENRQREETPRMLAQIQQQPTGQPQQLGMGQPISQAGDQPAAPQGPDQQRQARIAQLQQMTLIPQVANNPVVMQRLQSEIDRLSTEKPLIEHNFSVGEDKVQPHISHDGGRTWQPVPGSQPSAKFAKQVASTTPAQERLVPVKEADGRIVYLPASEARGREVGGRVTDVNLPKQVQQLGRDFEKAGLNQAIPVIGRASQITPEQASYITGPKSMLPDRAVPQDVRDARQDLQKLFNITLKDRSGAAVTNQELERLKQEFGTGVFKTASQLMTAVSRARDIIESHYQGVASSYGPEVLKTYNENLEAVGGTPFQVRAKAGQPATAQLGAPQAQQGPYTDAEKEKRYQEWKARQPK